MMDSRRRLKYLIHCCSCLNLSLNQQSLVVREENPLRTFLSCIPFFFFSASICLCLSVSLCLSHSATLPLCPPPLSCLLWKGPFTKKNTTYFSASFALEMMQFLLLVVVTRMSLYLSKLWPVYTPIFRISLNLYFILSVENHTLSTKIKIKGWTTEIFV